MKLKFAKVRDVKSPSHGTPSSAGYDFYIPNFTLEELTVLFPHHNNFVKDGENLGIILEPHQGIVIPSGIHVNLESINPMTKKTPYKVVLVMDNKSGVCSKNGVIVGANTIDEDYQGEMSLHILNVSNEPKTFYCNNKLVQGKLSYVLLPEWEEVSIDSLYDSKTVRGEGGFGSTTLK